MIYQKYVLNCTNLYYNLIHQPSQFMVDIKVAIVLSLCDVRAGGPLKRPTIPGAQPETLGSGAT